MNNYFEHLDDQYSAVTFSRKVDYIKYNLGELIDELSKNNASILEIGPGKGELVSYLNSYGITNIDIVDNSKDVIAEISSKFKINNALKLKAEDLIEKILRKYDLIVMIQVLEHIGVLYQVDLLKKLYKQLKSGGSLVIVVPNANNPLGIVERYGDYQHTISFTTQSLKDLVHNLNVKNINYEIKGFEIPPFTPLNIIRIITQKIIHLIILLILIANGGVYFKVLTPNIILKITKSER